MKKTLLIGSALAVALTTSAQNQSWTATDIEGNQVDIAAMLNSGKTVLVDISAYWCGPCWAWHSSGIMEKVYHEFGPEGTGDLEIIWVDGDPNTSMALLEGASGSQGDWVTGTPYPIIGPNGEGNALADIYGIDAYPTLFMHCPGSNAGVEIAREATWESFLASWKSECPAAFDNGAIDAHLLEIENGELCPGDHPFAEVFNQGDAPLTSATVELKQNGSVIETKNWTGSIAPFSHAKVSFDNTTVSGPVNYEVDLSVTGDANPNGDIEEAAFGPVPDAPNTLISLELKTDNYGEETTWQLVDQNNNLIAQDPAGDYADNTVFNYAWSLNPSNCYTFKIQDAYGDGICCSYGNGYYKLKNTWGTANVFIQGGQYGGGENKGFGTPATVGINDNELADGFKLFPNPTSGLLNIEFNGHTSATIDLFNVLGERVLTNTFNAAGLRTVDLSAFSNGVYYLNVTANGETVTKKVTLSK